MSRFKQLYDSLLETEDLKLYGSFTGDWEKDKKKFIQLQTDLEAQAEVLDVDFDEDL